MKWLLVIILALSLFTSCQHSKPAPTASTNENNLTDTDNYCNDQKSWENWNHLVRKYPNDSDLQALHALRIGLCVKIDQGSISLKDAIDIFNKAHDSVIEKAKKEQQEKKPSI